MGFREQTSARIRCRLRVLSGHLRNGRTLCGCSSCWCFHGLQNANPYWHLASGSPWPEGKGKGRDSSRRFFLSKKCQNQVQIKDFERSPAQWECCCTCWCFHGLQNANPHWHLAFGSPWPEGEGKGRESSRRPLLNKKRPESGAD